MWFRNPGGTPGAAWQALCPPSPSWSQSLGPPSGSAVPSASHRQTDEGKHCAPGPPGLAAAGQRRKTEKTTFHNAARDNFTHSNPPPPQEKTLRNFWVTVYFSVLFPIASPGIWRKFLEVSGCANSRFDCMRDLQCRCQIWVSSIPSKSLSLPLSSCVYISKKRIRRRWEYICCCFKGIVNLCDYHFHWLIISWLSKDLVSTSLKLSTPVVQQTRAVHMQTVFLFLELISFIPPSSKKTANFSTNSIKTWFYCSHATDMTAISH